MARRIDQVEDIVLAVFGRVFEAHRLRLDGDAALALEFHVVEHLLFHLARGQPTAHLNQAVGQRRLAVVDVRDDREISYVCGVGHGAAMYHPKGVITILIGGSLIAELQRLKLTLTFGKKRAVFVRTENITAHHAADPRHGRQRVNGAFESVLCFTASRAFYRQDIGAHQEIVRKTGHGFKDSPRMPSTPPYRPP